MQRITLVAIAAAAAAGIIGAVLFFPMPYISGFDIVTPPDNSNATGPKPDNMAGYRQVNVTINNFTLVADVAETNDQRTKGLAVKDTLNETEGMLFVFSTDREHSFWMKGMKFPIDIIWLSKFQEVVHVEHSLEPCIPDSFCPTYKPDRNALYVLETVAGFSQKHNVTENTYVDFQLDN